MTVDCFMYTRCSTLWKKHQFMKALKFIYEVLLFCRHRHYSYTLESNTFVPGGNINDFIFQQCKQICSEKLLKFLQSWNISQSFLFGKYFLPDCLLLQMFSKFSSGVYRLLMHKSMDTWKETRGKFLKTQRLIAHLNIETTLIPLLWHWQVGQLLISCLNIL